MPDSGMRELRRRWPMVGRSEALARTAAALRGAEPSAVVLRGPSGVGKTRLMEEYAATRPAGMVIRVAATRESVGLPLEALAELLSYDPHPEHGAGAESEDAAAAVGRARRALAARPCVTSDPRSAQVPLLAIDDLPWLDGLSVRVLAALVSEGAAHLVGTARADEPLPEVLMAWWRSGLALQVEVAALEVEQVGELLEQVLAGPVAPGTAAALHAASRGLPLHLRELSAGAVEAGELVCAAGVWRLSDEYVHDLSATPALRELLLTRISALPIEDNRLLDRLAVCSGLRLSEIPGDEQATLTTVTDLEEAGLVELGEAAGLDPLVRPAHPQIAAVLRERLPRLRARALLLEQVAALEARDPTEQDLLRITQWRLAATGTADPDTLLAATRRALAAHDHPTAERLAVAATTSTGTAESGAGAAWLLLARTRWESGRPQQTRDTLDEAITAAVLGGDDPDGLVLRCAALVDDPRRAQEALDILATLRMLVDAGDRRDLTATVAALFFELDRVSDAVELIDRFLDVPTDPQVTGPHQQHAPGGSPQAVGVLVGDASIVAARVYAEAGRSADAHRHAEQAVARARGRPDTGRAIDRSTGRVASRATGEGDSHDAADDAALAAALAARCRTLTCDGEPAAAIEVGREALLHAVAARGLSVTADIEYDLAFAHGVMAQPRASERWCRDIVSSASTRRHLRHLERGLSAIAFNAAGMGELDRMQWAFDELEALAVPDDESPGSVRARALRAVLVHGDRRGAWELLAGRARLGEQRGGLLWAATDWFQAVTAFGSPDTDPEAVAHLVAIAARVDNPQVQRMAAHAGAAAAGDLDGLVGALDRWEAHGCLWNARRALTQAVALAREAGDRRRATSLERRFDDLARRTPDDVLPVLDAPTTTPLTRREREIAELAAAGTSSADIATRLVLSVRTVNNHLGNAYTKLGITRRGELAAALRA